MDPAVIELEAGNWADIDHGLTLAKEQLEKEPERTTVLALPAGTWDLTPPPEAEACICPPRNIAMGEDAHLIIEGRGYEFTRLVAPITHETLYLRSCVRVHFRGIHFDKFDRMTTQGRLLEATRDWIRLEVDPGFPTIEEVYQPGDNGRYLMPYSDDGVREMGFKQVGWQTLENVGGRRYRLFTGDKDVEQLIGREAGLLLAIKSKHGKGLGDIRGGDGNGMQFCRFSEGARQYIGCMNPVYIGNIVERSPPIFGVRPVLSTNGGGPQFHGEDLDDPGHLSCCDNMLENLGDDGIALFNWQGTVEVVDNVVRNVFARSILIDKDCSDEIKTVPYADENILINPSEVIIGT